MHSMQACCSGMRGILYGSLPSSRFITMRVDATHHWTAKRHCISRLDAQRRVPIYAMCVGSPAAWTLFISPSPPDNEFETHRRRVARISGASCRPPRFGSRGGHHGARSRPQRISIRARARKCSIRPIKRRQIASVYYRDDEGRRSRLSGWSPTPCSAR
jgi:hypothetical protein